MIQLDLLAVITDTDDRFWAKVSTRAEGECWLWTAYIGHHGYGKLRVGGRYVRAHKWSYERFVGRVPDGLVLDHLCHGRDKSCPGGSDCLHRRCVNPTHLEPVTQKVNSQRGYTGRHFAGGGIRRGPRRKRDHCRRGHPRTPENTYISIDGRGYENRCCRICVRLRKSSSPTATD